MQGTRSRFGAVVASTANDVDDRPWMCYQWQMHALKARIENGRYVIDEKADLPDGTELYLVPLGEEDEERLDVEAADRALADAKANGEDPIPWAKVKTELGL